MTDQLLSRKFSFPKIMLDSMARSVGEAINLGNFPPMTSNDMPDVIIRLFCTVDINEILTTYRVVCPFGLSSNLCKACCDIAMSKFLIARFLCVAFGVPSFASDVEAPESTMTCEGPGVEGFE